MPDRPRTRYLSPVTIGRGSELDALREFLGRGSGVLLVSGEAGIGKSRLVAEARDIAESLGMQTLVGRSFEADRSVPYAPAIDVLQTLIESHGAPVVAELAGAAAADLALLAPELLAAPLTPPADRELARRRLRDGFARLLGELATARGQPLLLVIEDIHWPDASSLDLLLHLARRAAQGRHLLLMTYRDDEVHPDLAHLLATLDRERLASEVTLGRLTARQVAEMVQVIFRASEPAPADLLHDLVALSEGNPFYVEELLPSFAARAELINREGRWTRQPAAAMSVPRSVHDAVRQRVATLSDATRQVIRIAAVAGRRFDLELLEAGTGVAEPQLLELIKEMVGAQLVGEEREDRFAFRHALTREAIVAGLLERERRHLHRRIADALVDLAGGDDDQRIDELSEHYFAAAAWPQALAAARKASERALALHAPGAAAAHLTRAIEAARALGLPPDGTLHMERGVAYETIGEFDHAREDFQVALDGAQDQRNLAAAWDALIELSLLWSSRDYRRTGEFVERALRVAREVGEPSRIARSLNRLGNWRLNREEPQEAAALHREALGMLESVGDALRVAETLDLLGMAAILGGDSRQSHDAYTRAIAMWRELGDRLGLAGSQIGLTMAAHDFHTATVDPAVPIAAIWSSGEEGLRLTREIGWRAGESWALWGFLGMAGGAAGSYDVAVPATREGLAIAVEIEHRQWQAAARCVLGNILADLGDFSAARLEFEASLVLALQVESPYWTRSAVGWLASALIRGGQLDAATSLLSANLAPDVGRNTIAGRLIWVAQAEAALMAGRPDEALAEVDRLYAASPAPREQPIARLELLRGEALAAMGRHGEAQEAFNAACTAAQWSGAKPLLWRIHVAQGHLQRRLERADAAAEAFLAARGITDELAEAIADDALRSTFQEHVKRQIPAKYLAHDKPGPSAAHLTRRELEVAALLREGLTNREIGERLFLSEWTAATHVRNILTKLNLGSRAQIAAWAAERDNKFTV